MRKECWPFLRVIKSNNLFYAPNILFLNQGLVTFKHFLNDHRAELLFISRFIDNNKQKSLCRYFLCMRLILKFPMMFNNCSKLDSCSKCNVIDDFFITRNVKQSNDIALLSLTLSYVFFSLSSKIFINTHARFKSLHKLASELL